MNARGGRAPEPGNADGEPPGPQEWDIRLRSSAASRGWNDLIQQVPQNVKKLCKILKTEPCPAVKHSRHHPLKGKLKTVTVGNAELPQWQYEISYGGRVWYVADEANRIVWITHASPKHPKQTE